MTLQTIDDVRAYWDSRPCNVKHSLWPSDTLEYHFEVQDRKYFVEPHIPSFAEFEKWNGKRVLEIGCGIGTAAINFAQAGADVFAIDLSEQSLKIARKRAEIVGVDVTFGQVNAEDQLWFRNSDLVYAFGSIHHSPNPEKIIINARKNLRPGGALKIMVYNKYSWKSLWVILKYGHGKFWKFRELIAKYSEAQTGCPITRVYSEREIRAMLERNGFTVRKAYKDHIFPYDIEAYRQYRYERTWYWKLVPAPIFRWLERHFGWHLMVEATA